MTLLFYSAAQIDEDKGMKERQGRQTDATRHSQVGRSHLGDEIGRERLSDDNGVFSLYGVVRSAARRRIEGLSSGRKRPRSRWSPQMLPHFIERTYYSCQTRTPFTNSAIKHVAVGVEMK